MSNFLFDEFDKTTPTAWKQKIQVDLNGEDYNESLLWKTNEGIVIKPFYTSEDRKNYDPIQFKEGFNICQTIFVDQENIANSLAIDALERGANSILFKANSIFDYRKLLLDIDTKSIVLHFHFSFLDAKFQTEIASYINSEKTYFQTDIIGNLAESGNWFVSLKEDFDTLDTIQKKSNNCIAVAADLYQNTGATITQQLAYSLAHANEYLNQFGGIAAKKIHFIFSVGSNYFFEIAKLRAFRILWSRLLEEYNISNISAHLFVQPSHRNKTLYDYNVNLLRTTSECMSAILGGANTVSNISYDTIYQKSNEFGERIARNQLLILQQESSLSTAQNMADGSYYIESITHQLAEKALVLFKEIEKSGGFLKQLKIGTIQKKIKSSASKEEKEARLLGTNFQQNSNDRMQQNIVLYPFVKKRPIKTLISPLTRKRISESLEKERLLSEKEEITSKNE